MATESSQGMRQRKNILKWCAAMLSLSDRLQKANALLAPYAVPHDGVLGREHGEPQDETRFPFQRDRDRIIHTQAFRRLKGKTQVFVEGSGDHVRTRLTHTMEVAQISRDIARALGLNEDLTECIALAHDLGHPPFGHAGEAALNGWMERFGLHFEHNEQSHRIVTLLEEHSALYPGLNLNREILDGLLKHTTPYDIPPSPSMHSPTLEAQVVNIADEIAYTGHDCEDGVRAELFPEEKLLAIPLALDADRQRSARGTSLRGALIHLLVCDLYRATEEELTSQCSTTLDTVLHTDVPLIRFSKSMRLALDTLRDFLQERMYAHPRILERNRRGVECISTLCHAYHTQPNPKVLALQKKTGGALEEAIKDYVSGMTDAYALQQERVLPT